MESNNISFICKRIMSGIEKYETSYNNFEGFYRKDITPEDVKANYMKLKSDISSRTDLTDYEKELLHSIIDNKIANIGSIMINRFYFNKLETVNDYLEMLDTIHREHRYDDVNVLYGDIVPLEAKMYYDVLLNRLSNNTTISSEDRYWLEKRIMRDASKIQDVEHEKYADKRRREEQKKAAFLAAKRRFKKLSIFDRVYLKKKCLTPSDMILETMNVKELNTVYSSGYIDNIRSK